MKKIAIPITEDNKVEDHFGHCKFYEVYTFSDTNELISLKLLESDGKCGCKSNIINILKDEGITLMLSGNIGEGAKNKLDASGISVIRGCSGKSADVILDFLEGKISDNGVSCDSNNKANRKAHSCSH